MQSVRRLLAEHSPAALPVPQHAHTGGIRERRVPVTEAEMLGGLLGAITSRTKPACCAQLAQDA